MASVSIVEDTFGCISNPITKASEEVQRFTFRNENGISIQVITYGATITSIRCPDKYGNIADIVLGFDDIHGMLQQFELISKEDHLHLIYYTYLGYQSVENPYFGASIGRVCNRIGNGKFNINGKQFDVIRNLNGKHQLHGGQLGFDKFNWEAQRLENKLVLTHVSPDGFQGYPGTVFAQVTFELLADTFSAKYTAAVSKSTPINLTNHSYFNLAGHVCTFFLKKSILLLLLKIIDKIHMPHRIKDIPRYTSTIS